MSDNENQMAPTEENTPAVSVDEAARAEARDIVEPRDTAGAPELARHRDPSLAKTSARSTTSSIGRRSVVWVRPSDLAATLSSQAAGRGIDFQAELARRSRRLPARAVAVSRQGIARRADRLPLACAFGASRHAQPPGRGPAGIS